MMKVIVLIIVTKVMNYAQTSLRELSRRRESAIKLLNLSVSLMFAFQSRTDVTPQNTVEMEKMKKIANLSRYEGFLGQGLITEKLFKNF